MCVCVRKRERWGSRREREGGRQRDQRQEREREVNDIPTIDMLSESLGGKENRLEKHI